MTLKTAPKSLTVLSAAPDGPATGMRRTPAGRHQLIAGGLALAASILVPDALGDVYWAQAFQLVGLFVIAAISQNLLVSDAGQASFGQGAVFGLAAYVVALATSVHGWSLPAGLALGLLAALALGLLFALPALRVQHFYLGFVTLSAAIVLPELGMAFPDYTNGIDGISVSFPQLHERILGGVLSPLALIVAVLAVAALAAYQAFRHSLLCRRMRVAAASAEAAQSLGISPAAMRFAAFLLAAAGTGVGGVLYPVVVGFVAPTSFGVDLSVLLFFAVVVGGRGTLLGPVVGVWLLYLLPNALLAHFVQLRLLAYGIATLAVIFFFPEGVVGAFDRWRQRRAHAGRHLDLRVATVLEGGGAPDRSSADPRVPAIAMRNGRKTFGKVAAVDGVDLEVTRGEIHGLVGANGSGKTSLLNALSGFSRLDGGSLHIDGREMTGARPHRLARLGMGRTFQTPRIFSALSLWDNVRIGSDARPDHGTALLASAPLRLLREAMDGVPADWVPHGQRRLIEVLRVVLKGSHILLLDEPAAGLSPEERRDFSALLRHLRDDYGTTIVLVEHDLELVWDVTDRITVLDAGKVVASGRPADVAAHPAVAHMFIEGRHA